MPLRTLEVGACERALHHVRDEPEKARAQEKAVRRWVKNRGTVREWIKTRERNEALDLEVYCLAALYILGPAFVRSLPERAAALTRPVDGAAAREPAPALPPARRPGWIDGWRG